jgi:hypothetical protein
MNPVHAPPPYFFNDHCKISFPYTIILKWVPYKMWGCGIDSVGSEQGPVASSCECSNEPSGSLWTRHFLISSAAISSQEGHWSIKQDSQSLRWQPVTSKEKQR